MDRRCTTLAAAATLLLLGACGSVPAPPGTQDGAGATAAGPVLVEPGELLVAHGLLMQSAADRPVEICVGGVNDSLPPQCGGPVLLGDFSWDEVGPERVGEVTWTQDPWWAVGTFDPDGGEQGSLTLDRPVSGAPPQGYAVPAPEDLDFPQLCADPFVDGDRAAAGDLAAQEALTATLADLDGYVTSWVSDGSSLFNVVVTTDADDAFDRLREVWQGGLCVEQRDLPTQDQLLRAQEALATRFQELRLLSTGAGGVSGRLEVQVLVTDRATVDAVLEAVSPWLEAGDVDITGALRPLRQG